jgi:hypothetical protein
MNKPTIRSWILVVIFMIVASSSVVISFFLLFDLSAFEGTRIDFLSLNTRVDYVSAALVQLEAKISEETPLPAPPHSLVSAESSSSFSEDKKPPTEIQPGTEDVVGEAVLPRNDRLVLDEEVSRGFQAIRNPNSRPVSVEYSAAFVLLAHDRVDYIKRAMEGVLRARNVDKYTIYVSVDSRDNEPSVRSAVLSVANPKNVPIAFLSSELPFARDGKYQGEPSIPRHMASVFNHIFRNSLHEYIIILEDDLDVSVDFFDYFASVGQLLHPLNPASKGLFCVSAWNDTVSGILN